MKNFSKTYLLVALASIAALLAGAAVSQAAKTNKGAVKKSVSWIRGAGLGQFPGTGFQTETISALAASRKIGVKVPSSVMARFLTAVKEDTSNYVGSAGATGKVMLAAAATRQNPRCFGPGSGKEDKSDLFNILMSDYNAKSGQFGRTSFDHALAILGLRAAAEKIPSKSITFAKKRRGKYGWNFAMSKSSGDDVESSALMIEALRAAGVSKKDGALKAAYKWITYQRNQYGGYNPDAPQGGTQADTTSYAVRAFDVMGIQNHYVTDAKRALRALQKKNGSFRSMPPPATESDYHGIATTNVTLALTGQHYPVVVLKKHGDHCG